MTMASVPADPDARPAGNPSLAFPSAWVRPSPRIGTPIDVLPAHPEPAYRDALHRFLDLGDQVTVVAVTATETDASDAVVVIDDRLAGWRLLARNARIVLLTGETDMQALGTLLREPAAAYLTYGDFEPADR